MSYKLYVKKFSPKWIKKDYPPEKERSLSEMRNISKHFIKNGYRIKIIKVK